MTRLPHAVRRRGSVIIAATWVLIALAALALVLAQQMRVETLSSANQLAQLQADAVERGGEQFVLSQVDGCQGDAVTVTAVLAEARQVGAGYFWILRPNPDDRQQYAFGITDEAGKLNLNTATAEVLAKLPAMTGDYTDAPTSIVAWRGNGSSTPPSSSTPSGASSTSPDEAYYMALPQPYHCKNSAFESVEELLLVHYVDPQLLFGYDTNHNSVLDAAELAAGGMTTQINAAQDGGLGILSDVTVWTSEPNKSSTGTRININTQPAQLLTLITQNVAAKYSAIARIIYPNGTGRGTTNRQFANVLQFYTLSGLTAAEFDKIADQLTTSTAQTSTGLINVNTASRQVLAALPGLDDNDAQSLIARRSTVTTTTPSTSLPSVAWVADTLPHPKAVAIGNLITNRSYQYSADIVGVSGDGRAYKRVRIVVDVRQSPPKMLYRKELTDLGWPLDPSIRESLRAGQGLPGGVPLSKGGL